MIFKKKKKLSELKQRSIECSSCFTCGWRIPLHNNPVACLWELRNGCNGDPDEELTNRPKCEMYVQDTMLKAHLRSLLKNRDTIEE